MFPIYKANYPLTRIYTNIDFKSKDFIIRRSDKINGYHD